MNDNIDKKLVHAVLTAAREIDGRKKLTCAEAFRLAEEFQVEKALVGRVCDENEIKLHQCQLGCF